MNSNLEENDVAQTIFRTEIQKLYANQGIIPNHNSEDFLCPYISKCSKQLTDRKMTFLTGTWPYVGAEYGAAKIHGKQVRILFVAMDRGGRYNPKNEPTFAHTQNTFRIATEKPNNPHMGGVSQLIEYLVDKNEHSEYSKQFALTNVVKCVWHTNRMASGTTKTMLRNCSEHLKTEVQTLNPHIIVTQGEYPKNMLLNHFKDMKLKEEFNGEAGKAILMNGTEFLLLTTPHPARKKGWAWKRGGLPKFLQEAVERTKDEIRER